MVRDGGVALACRLTSAENADAATVISSRAHFGSNFFRAGDLSVTGAFPPVSRSFFITSARLRAARSNTAGTAQCRTLLVALHGRQVVSTPDPDLFADRDLGHPARRVSEPFLNRPPKWGHDDGRLSPPARRAREVMNAKAYMPARFGAAC